MSQSSDADQDFIAAAMPAFISEAGEQTEAIETLLLELEEQPDNRELLDSLFRCAHTVKGSAGIFGLGKVVEFTHHVETLLDKLRDGELSLTPAMSTLLLQCNDQIKFLVDTASDDSQDTDAQKDLRADLVIQLQAFTEGVAPTSAPAPATRGASTDASSASAPAPDAPPDGGMTEWQISARFGPETFRNGMDPLSIVKYLRNLGTVKSMHCSLDTVPSLLNLNPETCYLSFVMALASGRGRDEIEGAFSFVIDDCELDIKAPESVEQKLVRAIEDMPATPRLGDMLVSVGAVSQAKLTEVLSNQELPAQSDKGVKPKIGNLLETKAGVPAGVVEAALNKQQKAKESAGTEENRYIRVQADRLDAVINLLGELVIAGAGANLLARETRNVALIEANLHMNALIEEIRNGTLGLRMVPVGETFSRFRRVVRDTASSLGKEVNFEIVGGEAELDKSMVEKIADPLMHLVRNSLDHGLEPPQERIAAGKTPAGKLTLSARHETGAILIRIEDDGRGINRERVLQRAWNRGLIENGVVPSDDVINMMIFEPGFSTAEQVTNLSGRGVGMDVVKRNIESLRGTLSLDSRPGRGLRVDIRLPLTLAIIDGFLVGVGRAKFVLPLGSVVEVIEAAGDHVRVDARGRHMVELRGAVLPVVRLRSLYHIESSNPERTSVVVVGGPKGKYGIEVEVLLGQQQTVIKPLGRLFKTLRGISGSSILGSGEVALILDIASLGELVTPEATATRTANV
ncbi:MAG: chemotaxis protein CheA [Rhodoferax sp.]